MIFPEITKKPDEMFSVGLRYVTPDLAEGGEIQSAEVEIIPDQPGGLKKSGTVVIEEDTVSQVIYGGQDGKEYYVKFRVGTSGGHIYEDAIFIKVRL